jgi:hypothetical protein
MTSLHQNSVQKELQATINADDRYETTSLVGDYGVCNDPIARCVSTRLLHKVKAVSISFNLTQI